MSDSDWGRKHFIVVTVGGGAICAALILVLVWALSARNAQDHIQAERYADYYSDRTIDDIQRLCPHGDIAERAKCEAEIIKATREAQHDAHDLNAQRDSANWGFWMMMATGAGLAVSGIGLAALFVSLSQTRTAIKDNREIGEAQVRAYLILEGIDFEFGKAIASGQFSEINAVQFKWRNRGDSPAKNVKLQAFYDFVSPGDCDSPLPETIGFLAEMPFGQSGMSRGQGKICQGPGPSIENLMLWHAGKREFLLYCAATYKDVFDKKCQIEACSFAVRDATGRITFRAASHSNSESYDIKNPS
jgi:hypothetical protein